MKKILAFGFIVLCALLVVSCKGKADKAENNSSKGSKDYGFEIVEKYYRDYTEKLSNANDSVAIDCITKAAVEDYRKMVADNADKFVDMLTNSAQGNIDPEDPAVKAIEEAWKECNLMLSKKTFGKYDYMPDFNDMYSLLYDKLPKELKEPVKPADIPRDVFEDNDECGDDCEHDHGNPFLNPSF